MTNYVHVLCTPPNEVCGIDAAVFNAIIAAGTLLIAGLSIWISIRTAKKQGQLVEHQINHDKLSVMPNLAFHSILLADANGSCKGCSVVNSGLGPAIMAPPLLLVDGEPVGLITLENQEVIENKLESCDMPRVATRWITGGSYTLPANEQYKIFWIPDSTDVQQDIQRFTRFLNRANIVIPYSSIYHDEIWFSTLDEYSEKSMYPSEEIERIWPALETE